MALLDLPPDQVDEDDATIAGRMVHRGIVAVNEKCRSTVHFVPRGRVKWESVRTEVVNRPMRRTYRVFSTRDRSNTDLVLRVWIVETCRIAAISGANGRTVAIERTSPLNVSPGQNLPPSGRVRPLEGRRPG
jgi:hypothetical protein